MKHPHVAEGYAKQDPKLIGNAEKAQQVMLGGTSTRLEVKTLGQILQKQLN